MANAVETNKQGLALEGYDTVAYFTAGDQSAGASRTASCT